MMTKPMERSQSNMSFSPISPSFENTQMVTSIAKEVHASLYGTTYKYQQTAITNYYRSDAKFEDPLVSVTGIQNILSQFHFLCVFSSIETKVHNIATSTTVQKGATTATDVVTVDSITTFNASFIPIKVRILSRFEFDSDLKIVLHEDVWSIADLISATTVVGALYNVFRKVNGVCSSFVIDRFLWALERYKSGDSSDSDVHRVPMRRREVRDKPELNR